MFSYAGAIPVYYDETDKKHPSGISKNLLKCWLNISNIEFSPKIKDIEQFEKNNPDISITIFEYDGFHKIKEDAKEGIRIKNVRVSPYALKRKHLVELLIIKEKLKDGDTNEIIEKLYVTTIKLIKIISRIKVW